MARPTLPEDLIEVLAIVRHSDEMEAILGDLLTPAEIEAVSERWEIVKLLAQGYSQRRVREALGASLTTISRGSRQLKYGHEGFGLALTILAGPGKNRAEAPEGTP